MKIAERLSKISASPTIAVMQESQALKAQGIDVIDLGPGEPDFPTPDSVKLAAIQAINEDFTRYTPTSGVGELRSALAEKFNKQWGTDFSAANVVVTAGAKHGIYNVCMAIFEEGDEVLNPAPYWVTFPEVIKICGARPIDLVTPEEKGFVLDAEMVAEHLSPTTKGVIINTPNNPTGALIPRPQLEEIATLARERNLFVLFDETYEYFTYEGTDHTSLASFVESEEENYAILGSFSKTYAMTGWRVGYILANRKLVAKLDELQSHQTGNATSVAQKAAIAALAAGTKDIEVMTREYARRREYVLSALGEIPGVSCPRPFGAFYAFPNVSQVMQAAGISTSVEFSKHLIQKARVATVPGSAFGMEGYIRLSYATSMENLREAFSRLRELFSEVAI